MKKLMFFLLVMASTLVKCQNSNSVTVTEFDNIKINNVKLVDIKNTFGELNAVQGLFGVPVSSNIDPDGEFMRYEYNGLIIGFSSLVAGGTHDKPLVGSIRVINNQASVTIKGIVITIGDNINKLGNVAFNIGKVSGNKSIIYQPTGWNSYFSIKFSQTTNVITKITYTEMT